MKLGWHQYTRPVSSIPGGPPKATRAYAWSSAIPDSDQRRFYAVLHLGEIRLPLDAARAAIVAERKHEQRSEP